jgi:predicted esterase
LREVWFVCHGFGQLASYFVKHFAPLDDGTRLIVAPEALSRFYLGETDGRGSRDARVGATWMTREDRLAEIADYVSYLDAVHDRVIAEVGDRAIRKVALGFSQGAATAARWVALGRSRVDELVLWASALPPELGSAGHLGQLREVHLTLVLGTRDEFATAERLAVEEARLRDLGLSFRVVRFEGGHQLHAGTLVAIAGTDTGSRA